MELRHLRYFVAVAEELNFTRAAERLHIAQPPLSTQIKALEDELGAPLFTREKKRVLLTQAGRELLVRAREILGSVQHAKTATSDASKGITGRLTLGYTASAMFTERLPRAIRQFRQTHADTIRLSLVDMTSVDQVHALYEERLDVGVLRRPDAVAAEGVMIEPWYHARLVAAVAVDHLFASRPSLRVSELRNEPLITYPRQSGIGLYWTIVRLCGSAGFKPHIAREVRETAAMIGLVAAGAGIAIMPEDCKCIALPGVVYVRLSDKEAVSTLSLAYRDSEDDPHVKKLVAALRMVGRGAAARA